MKKMLFVTLLSISLILGVTPIGYTGNPLPPPTYEDCQYAYMGPDIKLTVTFEKWGDGFDKITLEGTCKNQVQPPTVSYLSTNIFECVNKDWLLGTCSIGEPDPCYCTGLPQAIPSSLIPTDCWPPISKSHVWAAVHKVINFTENLGEEWKSAQIIFRFAVENCPPK